MLYIENYYTVEMVGIAPTSKFDHLKILLTRLEQFFHVDANQRVR